MVTLRFARAGTNKRPVFHIVATDSRDRRDGRFIEKLGYFIPQRDIVVLAHDRVDYWLSKGALPSESVAHLIKKSRRAAPAVVEAAAP